ncbi:MAG TPA: MFS transporter [bacterium]|nr:MFS transporter [bacterium]
MTRDSAPLRAAAAAGWGVFVVANAQRIDVVPFFNDLRALYHVEYAAVGGLLSAYLLGYVLAQIPAGLAADNFPTRRVTLAGLAAITAASAFFPLTASYWPAMLLRFAMGASAAMLYSSTVKLVLAATPNRGAAMGALQSGAGTGMLVGLFLMPLLSQGAGVRAAFLALAALSAVTWACAAAWLAPGTPARAGAEPLLAQVGGIVGQRQFAAMVSCVFLALFSAYGITAWLPTYLRNEFKFGTAAAGAVASIINLGLIAASPLAGTLSDRLGTRARVVLTGFALLCAAFALLISVHSAAAVAASAALAGAGLALTLPILTTLTTDVFGIQRAGIAVSLNLAVGQVASTISGVLFGYLLDVTGSFPLLWTVAFAAALTGLGAALRLSRMVEAPRPARG